MNLKFLSRIFLGQFCFSSNNINDSSERSLQAQYAYEIHAFSRLPMANEDYCNLNGEGS